MVSATKVAAEGRKRAALPAALRPCFATLRSRAARGGGLWVSLGEGKKRQREEGARLGSARKLEASRAVVGAGADMNPSSVSIISVSRKRRQPFITFGEQNTLGFLCIT